MSDSYNLSNSSYLNYDDFPISNDVINNIIHPYINPKDIIDNGNNCRPPFKIISPLNSSPLDVTTPCLNNLHSWIFKLLLNLPEELAFRVTFPSSIASNTVMSNNSPVWESKSHGVYLEKVNMKVLNQGSLNAENLDINFTIYFKDNFKKTILDHYGDLVTRAFPEIFNRLNLTDKRYIVNRLDAPSLSTLYPKMEDMYRNGFDNYNKSSNKNFLDLLILRFKLEYLDYQSNLNVSKKIFQITLTIDPSRIKKLLKLLDKIKSLNPEEKMQLLEIHFNNLYFEDYPKRDQRNFYIKGYFDDTQWAIVESTEERKEETLEVKANFEEI
jgi:hypothetical protein